MIKKKAKKGGEKASVILTQGDFVMCSRTQIAIHQHRCRVRMRTVVLHIILGGCENCILKRCVVMVNIVSSILVGRGGRAAVAGRRVLTVTARLPPCGCGGCMQNEQLGIVCMTRAVYNKFQMPQPTGDWFQQQRQQL